MTRKFVSPGSRFGHWTVIGPAEKSRAHRQQLHVRCDCGTERATALEWLLKGKSTSCGCKRRLRTVAYLSTHGQTGSLSYKSWCNMRARCRRNRRYVQRGIVVCDRWESSFEAFLNDMGDRPSPDHQIDRINNDGNYEPGNCRWATRQENTNNRSVTKRVTWNGQNRTLMEWSKLLGISYFTLRARFDKGYVAPFILGSQEVDADIREAAK